MQEARQISRSNNFIKAGMGKGDVWLNASMKLNPQMKFRAF